VKPQTRSIDHGIIDEVLDLAPKVPPWLELFDREGAAVFMHPTMPVIIYADKRGYEIELLLHRSFYV
jgi:hypothetical protein